MKMTGIHVNVFLLIAPNMYTPSVVTVNREENIYLPSHLPSRVFLSIYLECSVLDCLGCDFSFWQGSVFILARGFSFLMRFCFHFELFTSCLVVSMRLRSCFVTFCVVLMRFHVRFGRFGLFWVPLLWICSPFLQIIINMGSDVLVTFVILDWLMISSPFGPLS